MIELVTILKFGKPRDAIARERGALFIFLKNELWILVFNNIKIETFPPITILLVNPKTTSLGLMG